MKTSSDAGSGTTRALAGPDLARGAKDTRAGQRVPSRGRGLVREDAEAGFEAT
jgi:hypothetical protein